MRSKLHILVLGLMVSGSALAVDSSPEMDSLKKSVEMLETDSLRLIAYRAKYRTILYSNSDLFVEMNEEMIRLCKPHLNTWDSIRTPFYSHVAIECIGMIGFSYSIQGNHVGAIRQIEQCLRLAEKVNDLDQISAAHNFLGFIHAQLLNSRFALIHFKLGLETAQELGDTTLEIQLTTNIGATLDLIADSAQQAGNLELCQKYQDSAMYFFGISQALCNEGRRTQSLITVLNNMGNIARERGELELALSLGEQALEFAMEGTEKFRMSESYFHLSQVYYDMEDYPKALQSAERAFELSQEVRHLSNTERVALALSNIYEKLERPDLALKFYDIHIKSRDSTETNENHLAAIQEEFRNANAVESARDSAVYYHRQKLQNAEISENNAEVSEVQAMNYTLYGFVALVILLMGLMFWGYRRKKRDHRTISNQKAQVDEHRQKILRSISYAERIQRKVLPKTETIRLHLPGFNALYVPCDIVSGDFYWYAFHNGSSWLALGDCTGHGVPGAFMSMMGSAMLKEIIVSSSVSDPATALETLDKKVRDALRQNHAGASDEGMEMALVKIDHLKQQLTYSGASQHLYIVKETVEIVKADMRSIGGFVRKPEKLPKFSNREMPLEGIRAIYLVTDGLEDQFGVNAEEKFGRHRFIEQISTPGKTGKISQVEAAFQHWRGNGQQIDDVSVLEIQLS